MTTLKQLVTLKRNLNLFKSDPETIASIATILDKLNSVKLDATPDMAVIFDVIGHSIKQWPYPTIIQSIIDIIDSQIAEKEPLLLKSGYLDMSVQHRRVVMQYSLPDDSKSQITAKIASYATWEFPVLEITPGDGLWTHLLQHAQPLIVADMFDEFLDSSISNLTQQAQNRIVKHKIIDNRINLPDNQFGFILCWNFFSFSPPELFEGYLRQCYKLLRPGGTFMFSYNDCNTPYCADLSEDGHMSYYTESKLRSKCDQIGYSNVITRWTEQHITWAEITKPGILSTAKIHPTIGIIKDIEQ